MADNKVKICPICGSTDIEERGDSDALCWECSNYIIPLVTPQEVR